MKLSLRKNPYRRPSLKEKYEELKKWKKLSKVRRKPTSKPGRKPAKSVGTIARHYKAKERDITSKYGLGKKKKPSKSKYKKKPRTIRSRYIQ